MSQLSSTWQKTRPVSGLLYPRPMSSSPDHQTQIFAPGVGVDAKSDEQRPT